MVGQSVWEFKKRKITRDKARDEGNKQTVYLLILDMEKVHERVIWRRYNI